MWKGQSTFDASVRSRYCWTTQNGQVTDVLQLCHQRCGVDFFFARREAHGLTRFSKFLMPDAVWMEECPEQVREEAELDCCLT